MSILDLNAPITSYSGPGGFNDLDMLEVGNGGMTYNEYLTHFSAWAVLKSPLLLGNDLRSTEDRYFKMVTNPEVIAMNQDPLGVAASLMERRKTEGSNNENGWIDVWAGPLANGDRVLMVLNRGGKTEDVDVDVAILGNPAQLKGMKVHVRDVWAKKDFTAVDKISFTGIPSHGVALARVSIFLCFHLCYVY
jgi:alpha-galactosidase